MFYYDYYYLLIMLPALVISLWSQIKVKTTFKKYSKVKNQSGMSGADAANLILSKNGMSYVTVESIAGDLTDHFDPRTNRINLSQPVYGESSVAAVGVAAHEAGHAVQAKEEYGPMKLRTALVPICNIGSQISWILLAVGLIFSIFELYLAGILAFSTIALFQLVTLPVEFNASSRALAALKTDGTLTQEEIKGARKVLSAAALTYVAALLTSVLQLLYYISRFSRSSRR